MTLEGCTALSVEMKTKFRTPNSSARSARHLVPLTLFCTASPTLHSISGTCLWAAAWKTTSGRYSWKSCRIRSGSVTLAMQVYSSAPPCMACSRRSILKMRFSPRPTSTNARGLKRNTWRQISEPMLPPAPVTITVRPSRSLPIMRGVQLHGGPPQQVADLDVADGNAMVAAEAVFQAADDLQAQPPLFAVVHQLPQPRAGQGSGNHQDVGRLGAGGDFPHVLQLPQHGDLPQPRFLRLLRAEKAADAIGQLAVGLDLVGQHAVGMIGADQQGPAGVRLVEHRPELLPVQPPTPPQRPEQRHGQAAIQEWNTYRKDADPGAKQNMAAAEVVDGNDAEHRHQRGADQGDQVGEGHVGPPAVIMAQEEEDGKFDRHDPGQPGPELRRLVAGQGQHEVESQQHRQPEHQGEDRQVPRRHRPEAQDASRWACCCSSRPSRAGSGWRLRGQPGPPHRSARLRRPCP